MVECLTPKILPSSTHEIAPRNSFMLARSASDNLALATRWPRAQFTRPESLMCLLFCLYVTYSKFFSELFLRLKSLWFTHNSLGPTKVNITSRCILNVFCLFRLEKEISGYPKRLNFGFISRVFPHFSDFIRPKSLTKYTPSYPGTFFQVSMACLITLQVGCATVEIPDLHPEITLPGSGECYSRSTLTRETYRLPKETCERRSKKAIKLYSNDWQVLRVTLLKNCLTNQCKQSVGALDELFQALDQGAATVLKLRGKK